MDVDGLRTSRLVLTRPEPGDVEDLRSMWSDPAVWEHFPSLRHTEAAMSQAALTTGIEAWEGEGLGWWVARTAGGDDGASGGGALVGNGGCAVRQNLVWNIGYRLVRSAWGHRYAQEIIAAARSAAGAVSPELAITAYVLEHNESSKRTLERAGDFTLAWRGPDTGNPDPSAIRLLYTDRPLDPATVKALTTTA